MLNGKAGISAAMAIRLASLGTTPELTPELWMPTGTTDVVPFPCVALHAILSLSLWAARRAQLCASVLDGWLGEE